MSNPLRIDLKTLPEEGLDICGSLPSSVLNLDASDEIKPLSPLTYELNVQRDDHGLLLMGTLDATFTLVCGRCVTPFPLHLRLENYVGEVEIDEDARESIIDLTDVVRDDILVALPSYPRCEDGNVEPRECPAQGRFDGPAPTEADADAAPQDTGVWDVLDQLKN